jgi:hypothetical protein
VLSDLAEAGTQSRPEEAPPHEDRESDAGDVLQPRPPGISLPRGARRVPARIDEGVDDRAGRDRHTEDGGQVDENEPAAEQAGDDPAVEAFVAGPVSMKTRAAPGFWPLPIIAAETGVDALAQT